MGIARAHRDSVLNSVGHIKLTMRVLPPTLYLSSLKNDAGMVATEGQKAILSLTKVAFLRTNPKVTLTISADRCSAAITHTPTQLIKEVPIVAHLAGSKIHLPKIAVSTDIWKSWSQSATCSTNIIAGHQCIGTIVDNRVAIVTCLTKVWLGYVIPTMRLVSGTRTVAKYFGGLKGYRI